MLSIDVLTNEVCIVWSDSFLVLASNGNTGWLCLMKSVFLHFPWWMIHRGDVVTRNSMCLDNVPDIAQREDSGGP